MPFVVYINDQRMHLNAMHFTTWPCPCIKLMARAIYTEII